MACWEKLWHVRVREMVRVKTFHRDTTHRWYSAVASFLWARTPVSMMSVPHLSWPQHSVSDGLVDAAG